MTFHKGQRVKITRGSFSGELGTIAYQRMAPPTYTEARAVSVVLDCRRKDNDPNYQGSMYDADEVELIEEEECCGTCGLAQRHT